MTQNANLTVKNLISRFPERKSFSTKSETRPETRRARAAATVAGGDYIDRCGREKGEKREKGEREKRERERKKNCLNVKTIMM